MFPSIHTLNVDLILELFGAFLDQTELFLGPGVGSKTVLGSTQLICTNKSHIYWIHKTSLSKLFEHFLKTDRPTDRPTDRQTD